MNDQQRLYFESVVRLAIGESPASMSNEQLLGVFGLLPTPSVNFTQWEEKLGIGTGHKSSGPDASEVSYDFDEDVKILRK